MKLPLFGRQQNIYLLTQYCLIIGCAFETFRSGGRGAPGARGVSADIVPNPLEFTKELLSSGKYNDVTPHISESGNQTSQIALKLAGPQNESQIETSDSQVLGPSSRPKKRSKNYASGECAKVIESNPEAKKASYIINEMTDEYMLNPCKAKIWFVIELCDSIQATQIDIANYELYSSTPKDLTVYFSDTYPASDWKPIGHFTLSDTRTLQSFDLEQVGFGKFIRVEFHSHYGTEHYCVISEVKVYGASMMDDYLVDEDNSVNHSNTTLKTRTLKRKISAYKVYRNMMVEPYVCGLTLDVPENRDSVKNATFEQPLQYLKEQPVVKPILPQPTQQPVNNNRTPPLKPSIFVELGNKVKTLEASLKAQTEDIERRLNEKNEVIKRTEAKVDKLKDQFQSFALIVIGYYVYKLMLDLM